MPGTGTGWQGLAPVVRLTVISDSPPASVTAGGGFAVVNPALGATYAIALANALRASFFLGATVPIGMGGGDAPDKGVKDARASGLAARAQLDNSLFAVNDFALIGGLNVAWVAGGLTVQAEASPLASPAESRSARYTVLRPRSET